MTNKNKQNLIKILQNKIKRALLDKTKIKAPLLLMRKYQQIVIKVKTLDKTKI